MPWQQRMIRRHARVCGVLEALALYDGRRRMDMVKQRGIRDEPFFAHQFFGIEAAVGTPEAHMALPRNLPCNPVVRHIVSLTPKPRSSVKPTGCAPFAPGNFSGNAASRAASWRQRGPGLLFDYKPVARGCIARGR